MRALAPALLLAAAAAPAAPVPAAPEATRVTVGAIEAQSLHDAQFAAPNDGKTFGVDAGVAAVAQTLKAAGTDPTHVTVSVNALLVRLPGYVVLIDTGLGPKAGGALLASLTRAGVAPGEVTDVLVTHAHGDHVGGLVGGDGTSAFPAATVRMAEAEWTSMQRPDGPTAAVARAIAPQVRPFSPGAEVLPGIRAVPLAGHTPGHSGYLLHSGGAQLLDVGDLVHSSIVSLAHPEWAMGFDGDKPVGKATRLAELARLARTRTLVFSPHFPYPGVGRVEGTRPGRYRWQPSLR